MGEEERTKERALLLMRFNREYIYNIGKELNIPYFNQFENYWDMDHHQGALEIPKVIADIDLLKLIKEKPPENGLYFGGFQGEYYTATKKGEVKFGSSWEEVRRNVQKALDKWDEKAYGLLQAMINKEGCASYFEIADEIEEVLGYDYVPGFLLARSASLKLIFKTGSNRYQTWTMPPEIFPVVREELIAYKKSTEKWECEDWKSDWKTDRYLVMITNSGSTQPAAIIHRLKKGTARGDMKMAGEVTQHPISNAKRDKEEFAKWIGMEIIEDSTILTGWFKSREER